MNNQRFMCLIGGADMGAKTLTLPFQIAFKPEVVETCFADGNHFGMAGKLDQGGNIRLCATLLVRMDAHPGIQVGMGFNQGEHSRKALQCDAGAERMAHARRFHGIEEAIDIAGEFRKIEMAM